MAQLISESGPELDAPWYRLNEDMIRLILQKLSRSSHYCDEEANARALAADFVSISRVNHELKAMEDEICWPQRLVLVGPFSLDYLHWLAKRARCVMRLGFRDVQEDSFQSREHLEAFAVLLSSCADTLVDLSLVSCHQFFASSISSMVGLLSKRLLILECTDCGIWKDYEALRAITSGCPNLRHIEISERWVEPTAIPENVVVAFAEGCPELQSVVFSQGVLDLSGLLSILDNCKNLEELRFVPVDNDYEPFLRGSIGTHVVNKTVEYISLYHQNLSLEKDLMPLLRLCPNVEVVRFEMDETELKVEDYPIEGNTVAFFEEIGSQYYRCAFVDYWNNYIDGEDWFE